MQFCDKINKGMARGYPRVLQTAFPTTLPPPPPPPPPPPLLLPPLWGKIEGGGTQKNRRHKRKGQKVGVLKGWKVGEIEGNGQYFAIKKGLK